MHRRTLMAFGFAAILCMGTLTVVAAEKATQAGPEPRSIIDRLTRSSNAVWEKESDGLRIGVKGKKDEGKLQTSAEAKVPVVITAVARADSGSVRLFYGDTGGVIIFDWEDNPRELRYQN